VFLSPPKARRRRRGRAYSGGFAGPSAPRRRRGPSLVAVAIAILVIAAIGGGIYLARRTVLKPDHRQDAVVKFVDAWKRGDQAAMYAQLDAASRKAYPRISFDARYRQAKKASGATQLRAGRISPLRKDGTVVVPVTVRTKTFGTLFGTLTFHPVNENDAGRIAWDPSLRLPGLRKAEAVRRKSGRQPTRGLIYDASGKLLDSDPSGASIAGTRPIAGKAPTGLQRVYDDRLAGHPSSRLFFGDRVVAKVARQGGRSVHTTIRLGLQRTAQSALGGRLGGVAVIRPKDGGVLALGGLAVSAPQPPGSTFKIITVSAALTHHVATPSTSYPIRTFAVLDGVRLNNASGEACGGSLGVSFAESCNSVFAPLGARIGAKKLVAMAKKFGFNQQPRIPAAKANTINTHLKDSLAVGSAAIGQERDLATPLGMASVGATIGNHGVWARPRVAGKVVRRRAVSAPVAGQVRDMMVSVVRGGTGTAAALPGVQVAGKTGTAELVANSKDPKDADAWFVAFAPASDPKVAVAVMLVGAGFGGTAAAPIARQVLAAAL
jgi:Penicillin binding protein transpeptidase domain/NTF2-like N-terminal transpeptidase domain